MAKKTKPDPYTTQAGNLAITRYGPEISALTALLRQAEQDRDLRLRQAKSGRQYSVGAVDQARPMVTSAYQGAQAAVTPGFTAGGGLESAALGARLGEAQALAQSQLAARRVSAFEGESAAKGAALRDFQSDRGKIGQRATDLAREQGAFTSQTITDLIGADQKATADANSDAAQMTQSERNALISAGIDPDTGGILPGHEPTTTTKPNKGAGWASTEAQAAASDEISNLVTWGKNLKKYGTSRQDAMTGLTVGGESEPVWKTVDIKDKYTGEVTGTKQQKVLWEEGEKGNEDGSLTGTQKMTDQLPKAKSQLLLTAALDVAYDGHLSRRTQRLLHARGIKLAPLGVPTFQEWLKTPEGQQWQRSQRGGQPPAQTPASFVPVSGDVVSQVPQSPDSRDRNGDPKVQGPASAGAILQSPGLYTAAQRAAAQKYRNRPTVMIDPRGGVG
jgi:hypothetical protein